jgi:hypothetical protein
MLPQIFLLSPASCSGQRARLLFREAAQFHLAVQLRTAEGAPLADVFSFLSGLYFRGKATYARAFQRPPRGREGIYVITTSRGLVPAETRVTLADLREFAEVSIDAEEPRYREPLARDAAAVAGTLAGGRAVLLGSVATGKYSDILSAALDERLVFPSAFVGRGDMSRGGLLLRAVDGGRELDYVPMAGAIRRGSRPPKLPKRG